MRVVTAAEIDAALTADEWLAQARAAFLAVSAGAARQPARQVIGLRKGLLGLMPGEAPALGVFGIKLVSLFPDAARHGLSSHQGLVVLFDGDSGAPLLLLDGARLTAWRTAAASVVASQVLARPDARRLALIGAGEQALAHLRLFRHGFTLAAITVWSRRPEAAAAFAREHGPDLTAAADIRDAITGADIICTVTKAVEPILLGAWLTPGQHVVAAGSSQPAKREIDAELVRRARVFVDWREGAAREAGDIEAAQTLLPAGSDAIRGEIGEVLAGRIAGRRDARDITLFKSLGMAAEDLYAADAIRRALAR
jgi:ornithine cyclodeaminase